MKYYLYRFAAAICPRLPAKFGYWFFARLGDGVFRLSNRNSPYFQNVRRVLGTDATATRVNAVARAGFQNLLKNYFDLFRAHSMTPEMVRAQLMELRGFEHVEHALKAGKGAIMGSAHFGAWDMIIQITPLYVETHVILPVERIKPECLFQYIVKLRSSRGVEIVPLEQAPRAMIKQLRAGRVVGLAFDRDITHTGPVVNFFGAPAQMPDGAVQLALKFDTPVIMGFVVRLPDNRCCVYLEPPIEFAKTGDLQNDIRVGVQKMATLMERYIRQYPEQWLMFQKIWEDGR